MSMRNRTLAAAGLIGALLVAGQTAAAPRLTMPETSFDFGFVPQNAKISHVFWLHSTGDDTLKIVQVVPG